MDVAATAHYDQDALELKGEKTSLLPVPGTCESWRNRFTGFVVLKNRGRKNFFYCSWKYCMCILIMTVLVLGCSDKTHSELPLILIVKVSNVQEVGAMIRLWGNLPWRPFRTACASPHTFFALLIFLRTSNTEQVRHEFCFQPPQKQWSLCTLW